MNWNNIDFNREYETAQTFLDGYSFDILILELTCNYRAEEITPGLVRKHAIDEIQKKAEEAVSIVEHNAKGIAKAVADYHKETK